MPYHLSVRDERLITDVSLRAGSKVRWVRLNVPEVNVDDTVHIGIDPGTAHLGLSTISSQGVDAWELDFSSCLPDDVAERVFFTYRMIRQIVGISAAGRNRIFASKFSLVVEGGSYGDVYGQIDLAHSRAAIVLAVAEEFEGIRTSIVPPGTIRKEVLGHGHAKPQEEWAEHLTSNAANALACALYSYQLRLV